MKQQRIQGINFKQILQKLGDNYWEHDVASNTTIFSSLGYEFLGYKDGDFNDNVDYWWQNIHSGDKDKLKRIDSLYKQGLLENHTVEYRMMCKDGTVKWILDRGVVTEKDEKGIPLKIVGTHTDVTRLKLAEEKVKDSDKKIRAMLASNGEGFFMIGFDYKLQMFNEESKSSITELFQREPSIGDNFLDYVYPERRELFIEAVEDIKRGREVTREIELKTPEGTKWLWNRYFPVKDDEGKIVGMCASSKDITEKKLIDNALLKVRAEREHYQFLLQSMLDNTPLVVFIKDMEGRYLVVNRSFRNIYQMEQHEIIGRTDFDICIPAEALRYQYDDNEVIRTLKSLEKEVTIETDGETKNLLLVKFPLFNKEKKIFGVGGIATDFTDKAVSRRRLIEAKKAAEAAEQLQEQFLANMSHEIRTPMNGIIGMTNILMATELKEDQKEFVNTIKESSDTLLFLINDILDLSKIKSGKISLEKIPFNIRGVVENTLNPFKIRAKEKDLQLELAMDMRTPAMLDGDPHRLQQILNNLLSNAIKFTDKGFVAISMSVVSDNENQCVIRFSVKDSGIGVPEDKIQSIFNSFEQADSSTSRKFGGTGLGLAITRKLITLQDGTVEVKSLQGKGTEFIVEIPYTISKVATSPAAETLLKARDNYDFTGKKVLVAEDNLINQKVIMHHLKKEGINYTISNNGREAIEILELGAEYDLIILDLQMPEMDGFQTAVYIRQKLKLATPIVALTASALRKERARCLASGMDEYMTKPFTSEDLKKVFRELLQHQVQQKTSPSNRRELYYDISHLKALKSSQERASIIDSVLLVIPCELTLLKDAALHERWDAVYDFSKTLNASLSSIKAEMMLKIGNKIEIDCVSNNPKLLAKIPSFLNQLTRMFDLVRPMLEKEMALLREPIS